MKKQNSEEIGQNLINQTISDEKARMNNTKVDIIVLEKPREKEGDKILSLQTTGYENDYPCLNKNLFIDIEKRQQELKPKLSELQKRGYENE